MGNRSTSNGMQGMHSDLISGTEAAAEATFTGASSAVALVSYAHGHICAVETLLQGFAVGDPESDRGRLASAVSALLQPALAALYQAAEQIKPEGAGSELPTL